MNIIKMASQYIWPKVTIAPINLPPNYPESEEYHYQNAQRHLEAAEDETPGSQTVGDAFLE